MGRQASDTLISCQKETYRTPYETQPKERLRQSVFGGSSNTLNFLPLGGRSHVGEGKLRMLIDEHPNGEFYVMNGNRALIKREKIERYLNQAVAV